MALADMAPSRAGRPSLALSSDGSHLVYAAAQDGVSRLILRRLDGFEDRVLQGTEGAFHPFFSPDGEWIGFFTPTELKKISIRGGTSTTLSPVTYAAGATWGENDTIVFSDREARRLSRVSAGGGDASVWLETDGGRLWWPEMLPNGKGLLVTEQSAALSPSIVLISLEDRVRRTLVEGGSGARYVPTGHLVYAGEGGILAAPFDLSRTIVTGTAVPVLDGVRREASGVPQFAVSGNGMLAYVRGVDMGITRPVWVDRVGTEESIPIRPDRYGALDLSPDGRHLAISIISTTTDLWLSDFSPGAEPRRLTSYGGIMTQATWTSNASVAFSSLGYDASGAESSTLVLQPIDGSEPRQLLDENIPGRVFVETWSADGVLAFDVDTPQGGDIWVLPRDSAAARPLLSSPASEWAGDFSPDGRWLAYMSDEGGQNEVWVTDYPQAATRTQLSTNVGDGKEPIWSPLGDEVLYRSGGRLYSVRVSTGPELQPETPQVLFEGPYATVVGPEFDVAPDAQKFILLKEPDQPPATEIVLVTNWFEELNRLVPN